MLGMREGKGFVAGCGASLVFPAVAAIASGAHDSWRGPLPEKKALWADSLEGLTRDMPLERPESGVEKDGAGRLVGDYWAIIGRTAPPLVHLSRASTSL